MSKPLVSVVIATYNSGPYLQEAIDSVLRQSIPDLELLVIDDGSTDNTRALVSSVQDERLSYTWQANAGQTVAKNHGVRLARGEFIAFCDGDDFWYPNKLELQLPRFAASGDVGVVYSATQLIDEHGKELSQPPSELHRGKVTEQLFMRNFVPFGTAVVRRECMTRAGGFDESLPMGIDWDLWLRISAHYDFDFVATPTYAYRVWSGQMSRNWRGRYSCAFRIMQKFVDEHPGRVSARLKRLALADTYANRGRARMHEHPFGAISDGLRAVALDPVQPYSWKTVGRTTQQAFSRASLFKIRKRVFSQLKKGLSPLVQSLTRSEPRIFTYHRFTYQPAERSIAVDDFRKQMLLLKDRCEILPLRDLLATQTTSNARPRAAITVDDGYADFFDLAVPVLVELGIRATVFVTTGFIEGKVWLWPDRIRALLFAAAAGEYTLGGFWTSQVISLHNSREREAAWHKLADQLVFRTDPVREQAIIALSSALGLNAEQLDMSPFRPMSWSQIQQLHRLGFEIADHSFSHPCLTQMSEDSLRQELSSSKSLLESKLGTGIDSFAYPNGTWRDHSSVVVQVLQKLGYSNAALSVPSATNAKSRFAIGRFPATSTLDEFRNLVDGYGILRHWLRF